MSLPRVSQRANQMPPSPIRKLVPFADEARKRGIKIYHLNIGQPDIPTPSEFMEAVRNYREEVLAYGHSKGSQEFLSALVSYYGRKGIQVEEKDIQVTTGGVETKFSDLLSIDIGCDTCFCHNGDYK